MSGSLVKLTAVALVAIAACTFDVSAFVSTPDAVEECDDEAQEIGAPYFNVSHCCPVVGAYNISQEYIDLCAYAFDSSGDDSSDSADPTNSTTIPDNSTTVEPDTDNNSTTVEPDTDNNSTNVEPDTDNNSTTVVPDNATEAANSTAAVDTTPRIVRRRVRKTQINIHDIESGASTVIISSPADYKSTDDSSILGEL